MENAVKMLIMVATVILGIALLTMFIYIFRLGASTNQAYDEKQAQAQLELYNNKFQTYNVEDNTIIEMLSVANLAYSINKDCDYDNELAVGIDIVIGSKTIQIPKDKDRGEDLKKNEIYITHTEKKSIYNMLDKTVGELFGDPGVPSNSIQLNGVNISSEKLSNTKYNSENNTTIYEFLFKCTEIKYSQVTRKINNMKFEVYKNANY